MCPWALCRGVHLLSPLAELLPEGLCSCHPPHRDPRLPLARRGPSPRAGAGSASSISRASPRAGGAGVGADDAYFSIYCRLFAPGHPRQLTKPCAFPAGPLPGSLPSPACTASQALLLPASLFGSLGFFQERGGLPPLGASRVCLPGRRELCVRPLLSQLLGSVLIFTSAPDTRLCVASPLPWSDCQCTRLAAGHG